MSNPHNPERYGEVWDQRRIDLCLEAMDLIRPFVIFSGGWAWHFMSPPGHIELKHAHDHKDIDLHCPSNLAGTVVSILKANGFEKTWTRYDRIPSEEQFRRYEKTIEEPGQKPVRITIDFFVKDDLPHLEIDGWKVVEPETLLTFYSTIHSSKSCFAVQAASKLLEAGEDPVGHPSLVEIPQD